MPPVPEGAQRSEDGHYWWDGSDWQPVPDDDPQHPNNASPASASASSAGAAQGSAAAEVTAADLQHITSEEQIDDTAHPYFAPDYDKYPDDTSAAEASDHLAEPAGAS
jgi:hypothetical protein